MRFAVLALVLAGCGKSEPRNDVACPHLPGADRSALITVTGGFPPTVLRRDLDLKGLAIESRGGSSGGSNPQGLTAVGHQLRFQSLVQAETARGRTCVWFDTVTVDLTPSSIQIFIPKEYPDGSCEYDAILVHEREHERVHKETLTAAAAEIHAALQAAAWLPARGNPLEITDRATDRAAAEEELKAKIRRVVEPVYASYKEKLAIAQSDLDRPDLYQWVSKRCAGWK